MKIAMAVLATFGWVSLLQAQTRLTGTVQDSATGEALSGAYVFTRGDATSTEAQGTFSLAWDGASPIEVRFLGYQTRVLVPTQNPVNIRLAPAAAPLKEVVVSPLRATANTPVAYTNLSAEELAARNDGRDIPLILNQTPSMVTTSDAGAGIGYTGMRIRGSDITRINVTINDIPLNDPESHGVFWVNTPDLVSSTSSIQVQRGVGTSTNGAGAFGASIHLETGNQTTPYGQLTLGGGSFGTYRANAAFGSGLLNQRWVVEGRLSTIQSEGFVDRARANLTSHYLQASYLGERTRIRAVQFSGREETYQAWYGIPEARFRGDVQGMVDYTVRNGLSTSDSLNLLQSGNTTYNFYTYANEVDNYGQDHYQLHWDQVIRPNLNLRLSGHYTRGKGYFEQYRNEDALASYNLPPVVLGADTVFTTDLVRRRWLDNHFYGAVGALTYSTGDVEAVLGGAINRYEGLHYGEIIWAQFASTAQPGDRYYNGSSIKDDANVYARITKSLGKRFQVYADLQLRRVFYQTGGTDNDLRAISADQTYFFFNPKAGIQYNQNNGTWYLSYAQANREPVRNDFIDAPTGTTPQPEQLHNVEGGYRWNSGRWSAEANGFGMFYTNQLILTGELNDVGAAVRTNVGRSYRAGVELQAQAHLGEKWQAGLNATLSTNKVLDFEEYIYDYLNGTIDTNRYAQTDLALSPSVMAGGFVAFSPIKQVTLALSGKHVGRQFLDNTSNPNRSLDPFAVFDLNLSWKPVIKGLKSLEIRALVNNLFNTVYAPNGYTYSYRYGSLVTENFYYPMAGTNVLMNVSIAF